jgi:hypothetical protein
MQGMGGPSVGIKIPDATIASLKTLYQNDKAAIISAKIRIFTDASTWSNNYRRTNNNFSILPIDKKDTATEVLTSSGFIKDIDAGFAWLKSYNLDKNPSYYDFTVTKTVKDIVEGTTENKALLVNIGQFVSTGTSFLGYKYTTRAFATERGVFVGSDKTNANRIQLNVIYGTKK